MASMANTALLLAVLLAVSHGAPISMLSFDAAAAKNRPVSKVITLLKDMLAQLEKEAEDDEEIYDKIACWCETNDKEKTKAIQDAEARITDLTSKVEELTATGSRLNTEITNLKTEVVKNQEALDKATAIRQKELAEFNKEEKDLLESVSALKAAIVVLSKHHPDTLFQGTSQSAIRGIAATLQYQMSKHSALLRGVLTHRERRVVQAFLQDPEGYFDATPTFKQSYTPQSGEIFGILKQMKETFETNLSDSQKEEMANQKMYEDLKTAKEEEITTAQAQIDTKTQELADNDLKLAQAKQDIEDTRSSLSADEQFLMSLKEKCQMTDQEWEERQKTRQEEMQAVSKAIAVLSSDDAHDLFTKTFNPALIEVSAEGARTAAAQLLTKKARELRSPVLATIAAKVRLDAFTKVKQAIDDMIGNLLKEKQDEIKHKDFCVGEFNSNIMETEKKGREKIDFEAQIEDLTLTIKALEEAITGLKTEIEEMQLQMKRAGEDREKANAEFQATISDQQATQKLLQQALAVLQKFYNKGAFVAVGQKQEPAGPPPPPGFQSYKKNAAAGGVMGMIQQIINDAKAMEAEAVRAEEDAQKTYEDFVKETNGSIEAKSKDIVNKAEDKAEAEADLVQTEEAKSAVQLELEQLSNYNGQLHTSCDFVLKNFDLRQTARDEEIEALKQAKAILSGAKFPEA